jgi:penicillin-binding protein 1A
LRLTICAVTFLVGSVLVAFNGAKEYLLPELPDVSALRDIRLQVPLRIYTRDGRLMQQFGEQRRYPLAFDKYPPLLIKAVIAAEDDQFFQHGGVDYLGLARAIAVDLFTDSTQGGGTITMLVARNFYLSPEQTARRKLLEIFLALRIEEELSKQEILALLLNKIELGHRAFGVGAAAEVYFGKTVDQLTLSEMAIIAGLPRRPSRDNPISNPERAGQRRGYVLRRMHEKKFIDDAQYAEAMAAPIESKFHGPVVEVDAPNVAEMVRLDLLAKFGTQVTTDGYKVVTTIDSRQQLAATAAVRSGLIEYDQRHGYRGPAGRLKLQANPANADLIDALDDYPGRGSLQSAVVLSMSGDSAQLFARNNGKISVNLTGMKWASPALADGNVGKVVERVGDVLAVNDVVYVAQDVSGSWRLTQVPQVQGAFVAVDPHDGAITAMVGGFDFNTSNFNRAVDARRQPGSSFKPFLYSSALEYGFTPATIVNDAPYVAKDTWLEGQEWRPKNFDGKYLGPLRLREALYRSRNPVAVRVMESVGTQRATQHMMQFGFAREEVPENLSLALGTTLVSPLKMAAAYSVFANGGYRVVPYFLERVEDPNGKLVYVADPKFICQDCVGPVTVNSKIDESAAAITPENAYVMTDMMSDVIMRGTAQRAKVLKRNDLAGKTGTTQDGRDTWFCGFNADLVGAAWVGFDQERDVGRGEDGGRTALPIWIKFMGEALAGRPDHRMPQPAGIVTMRISRTTGKPARAGEGDTTFEVFLPDHLPEQSATDTTEGEPNQEKDKTDDPLF